MQHTPHPIPQPAPQTDDVAASDPDDINSAAGEEDPGAALDLPTSPAVPEDPAVPTPPDAPGPAPAR
ncbi:MAG TPA: hypothetical protein VEZ89_01500 [Rubrivivax sp.]|nr:hypothetical protein [Rubrivivax sp.]